jgi:hypothetical protein
MDTESASRHFNGDARNIAVILGKQSSGLVDIDLDHPLALAMADAFLPPTKLEFGRKSTRRAHRLYEISDDCGVTEAFDANPHGMFVEYRANGGYTVFPGSVHDGTGENIEWDSEGIPTRIERAKLKRAAGALASATLLATRWTEGAHNNLNSAVAGALLREGAPVEMVENLIRAVCDVTGDKKSAHKLKAVSRFAKILESEKTDDGKKGKGRVPGWLKLEKLTSKEFVAKFRDWLGLTRDQAADDAQLIERMNAKYAVINWKGRALVLIESIDPEDGRPCFSLSTPTDIKLLHENQRHRKVNPATWWLRQPARRQYEGVVFTPKREVPGYYNLWQGWGCEPAEGDCSLFLKMVEEVICSNDEKLTHYVLSWCADAVQNPTGRPGVVLTLKGKQGAGKGTFAREFGELFGNHFFHANASRQLVGKFNAHLANVLLLFADEAYYAGDKQSEGSLKALITEPHMPLEFKGKDLIYVRNYLRVIMASNQGWVVPAGMDDRRFAVIEVSDIHLRDTAYFSAIANQMRQGGREALLHYLMNYDLKGLDLRRLPETQARWEQQLHSMTAIQKWWYGRLHSGAQTGSADHWADSVPTDEILHDYISEAGISGERFRGTSTELGMTLTRLVPGMSKRRYLIDKKQRWHYTFPTLNECREHFVKLIGHPIKWTKDSAAERAFRPEGDF